MALTRLLLSSPKILAAKTAISMIWRSPIMTVGVALRNLCAHRSRMELGRQLPVATKRRTDTGNCRSGHRGH